MNTKHIQVNYSINRMSAVDLVSIIHIDDYNTRFIELTLSDHENPFPVTGCTVTARFATVNGVLLNDNVSCTVTEEGTILIPIDSAAVNSIACDLKIEVNIAQGDYVLTLPFPLWVRVRGSILENAHISPESEGTIPELLHEVEQELERVQGFITEENAFEILDGALSGDSNISPTLLIDSTVNQTCNPDGDLIMYYIDSDDVRHNIFDFSPYLGTDDYNELSNKPRISGVSNSGDSVNTDLTGTLRFDTPHLRVSDNQQNISVNLGNDVFVCNMFADPSWSKYNFDLLSVPFVTSGVFKIRENRVENKPAALSVLVGDFYIVHFLQGEEMPLIRYVIGKNANNINVTFMQTASLQNGSGFGINYDVVNQSAWQEIGAKGDKGDKGDPGNDYILTNQDKSDIVNIVLGLLPTTQGVQYGNQSN